MGDDQPRPGISAFHATFVAADHCSSRFVLVVVPRASGPRNCGQFASRATALAEARPPQRVAATNTLSALDFIFQANKHSSIAIGVIIETHPGKLLPAILKEMHEMQLKKPARRLSQA
jgi:hypothetical protein